MLKEVVGDNEKPVEPSEYKHVVLNVFYLPQESRWTYIMENAKQDDIALKIDTALFTIEKTNPILKSALPLVLEEYYCIAGRTKAFHQVQEYTKRIYVCQTRLFIIQKMIKTGFFAPLQPVFFYLPHLHMKRSFVLHTARRNFNGLYKDRW